MFYVYQVIPSKTSISVLARVTKAGNLYCAALTAGSSILSVLDIRRRATTAIVPALANTTLILPSLSPDTAYDVYCYTDDFSTHTMTLADAVATRVRVSTLCCRSVVYSKTYESIVQYFPTSSRPESVFTVALDSTPSSRLFVNLTTSLVHCSTGAALSTVTDARVQPSSFTFLPTSKSLSGSFKVRGTYVGCYALVARGIGTQTYTAARTQFRLELASELPEVPILQNATLSTMGTSVLFDFSSPTDRGVAVVADVLRSFPCALLVSFPGSTQASCKWTNSNRLVADIQASTVKAAIGDSAVLRGGSVRALCVANTVCASYSTVPSTTVVIAVPSNPLVPVAHLYAPAVVSTCDNLTVDPTASRGFAGRKWLFVSWTVTALDIAQNAAAIQSYLNEAYRDTTAVAVVPQSLLTKSTRYNSAEYEISLQVTNFLSQTSVVKAKVRVDNGLGSIVPQLRLYGANVVTYRWKALSLYAAASYPPCAGDLSSLPLVYSWRLYAGVTLVSSIQSFSLDQRYFKLRPYTLQASTAYRIIADVSLNGVVLASTAGVLQVGQSGVSAVISGGNAQTASTLEAVVLDASGSRDIDYPSTTSGLAYQWACSVLSPEFGANCTGFVPSTTAKQTISAGSLSVRTYTITATVISSSGSFAQASVVLAMVEQRVPEVAITNALAKYNPGSKVILSASINAAAGPATVWWNSSSLQSFNASKFALTPLTAQLPQGRSLFQLALAASSLTPGLTYTFSLHAKYVTSQRSATQTSISISMNEPPVGGVLQVTPSSGTALTTYFLLKSSYWEDDESDFPLTHVLSYYLLSPAELIAVKDPDEVSYVTTLLGQGLGSRNYEVTCVVTVADIFQATASATALATVSPLRTSKDTFTASQASLEDALRHGNPTAISQSVGAALTSINSLNCTVPVLCSSIRRSACQKTAKTCGPCLTGYVGITGDSNVACNLASSLRPIGASCSSNSVCVTRSCRQGQCADVAKRCPGDCSGAGTCKYTNLLGEDVASCTSLDSTCQATCVCQAFRFGKSCALRPSELTDFRKLRESACLGLARTLTLQDASAEVVSARAQAISNALQELTQISDAALGNCTTALVETVTSNPVFACAGEGRSLVSSALSSVLARGLSLPSELLDGVTAALVALSEGCQAAIAVGEAPVTVENNNLRLLSAVADQNTLDGLVLESPLSAYHTFNGQRAPSLQVNLSLSGTDSLGITSIVFKNNPRGDRTNATRMGVKLEQYTADDGTTQRRRLATDQAGYTMVLQNNEPIHYGVVEPSTLQFRCFRPFQHIPYFLNGTCSSGLQLNFTCAANSKGVYNVSCPSHVTSPRCTTYAGGAYTVDENCRVVDYTPHNTTCFCTAPVNGDGRRMLQGEQVVDGLVEYSTVFAVVGTEFGETFIQAPSMTDVQQNKVIVSTLGGIAGVFVIGLLLFAMWDRQEYAAMLDKHKETKQKVRTVNMFFDTLFPDELRDGPWYLRIWNRMLLEHTWLRLYAPYDETAESRTEKWVVAMGSLLVFMFINSIVALLMYADDGYCEAFTAQQDCEAAQTAGNYFQACLWREDNESCEYNPPDIDFVTTIVMTLIVALVSVPFDRFWEYCVANIAQYMRTCRGQQQVVPANTAHKPLKRHYDEFCEVQTKQSTIMRAARLEKARNTMDFVLLKEEARDIRRQYRAAETLRLQHAVFGDVFQQVLVLQTRYGAEAGSYRHVKQLLGSARASAELIRQQLDDLDDPAAQEELLMKHFIIDVFTGYKRRIVSRYFLGDHNVLDAPFMPELQQWFCLVALPCYAAVMLYFILVLNISIGSCSTNLWLLVIAVSFAEDVLMLEPVKIWVVWMLINSQVSNEVRGFCESLSTKARLILRRTFGLMRDSNAMVQHFNPACRVARMYPALPISRLLMSVNDRDIPLKPQYSILGLSYLYFSSALLAIAFLPQALQESAVELATGSVVNFFLMAIAQFGSASPAAAIVTLVLLFLAIVYYAVDGTVYVRRLWEWCKPKNKVSPFADMYGDDDSEAKSDGDCSEEGVSYGAPVLAHAQSVRAGLFDKQNRVRLKEGQWRVIKQRVTKTRALSSLAEMNRKFHIQAALDSEVLAYAESLEGDSEATEKGNTQVETSPRRLALEGFIANKDNVRHFTFDEESPHDSPLPQEDGPEAQGATASDPPRASQGGRIRIGGSIGRFLRSHVVALDASDDSDEEAE